MKVVAVLMVLAFCVSLSSQQGFYNRSLQGIDVEAILNNDRILKTYIKCFLEEGPCTPEGREAKKEFPEVVKTNCGKCSEEQKKILKKTIRAFKAKHQKEWEKILSKYDPDHKKEKVFMKFINED